MIGMVLVTHGRLADELRSAMEHVVGAQRNVDTVCIGPEDSMEDRKAEIEACIGKLPRALVWFAAACGPCMAVVAITGAVQGSGPYNLLSFIPSLAWAIVILLRAIRSQAGGAAENRLAMACLGMTGAFLVGFAPFSALASVNVLRQFSDAPLVRQAIAEIDAEMRRHPGATLEVGPGPLHDLRVIPVFRGSPLPIDYESWADLNAGGVDPALLRKAIADCRVDYWLMPAGEEVFSSPFDPGLFPADFIADFHRQYRKEGSSGIFDRWRCIAKL